MDDIKGTIRKFIQDNFIMGGAGAQFADSDSFLTRRIIDSTGFLELVSFLEETFGFAVADEEMTPENLDSLDNIDSYVRRKKGQ